MDVSIYLDTHIYLSIYLLICIYNNERWKNRQVYAERLTAMICLNAQRNLLRKEVVKLFTFDWGEKLKVREVKVTLWPRVCGEASM